VEVERAMAVIDKSLCRQRPARIAAGACLQRVTASPVPRKQSRLAHLVEVRAFQSDEADY